MKLIFSAFSLFMLFAANAQTRADVRIYAYVQPVTGGANPGEVLTEDGKVLPGQGEGRKNYYIYLTGPVGQRIYPFEVFINGQQYSTRSTAVTAPVELTIQTGETHPKKITAVPKTASSVYQVTPSPDMPSKTLDAARQKASDNEVVVSYRLAGKMYYAVLKKMAVLEAAAME